ncbi:MAG: HAD family hydrolase [bacterium]|nr:HAD family hydrolase [bacterium]
MKASILSFDLDNTLLDHRTWCIPDTALACIQELRERFRIVLATGRNMDDVLSLPYKELLAPDAIVHLNGGRVSLRQSLSPLRYSDLFQFPMDSALLAELLSFARSNGLCLGMHEGDADYFSHPDILRQIDLRRFGESCRNFVSPDALCKLPVYSLTLFGSAPDFSLLQKAFPQISVLSFANGYMADLTPKGNSKASALQALAHYWKEDLASVIAFGDDRNDLELLQAAGIGIAMGNASEEVKAAADYVTAPIHEDGIQKACRHFQLC